MSKRNSLTIIVLFQDAHSIEGGADIHRAKAFVLIIFQAVLIVQMNATKLAIRPYLVGCAKTQRGSRPLDETDADSHASVMQIPLG